jgi:2-polyprenyl-6-methoxyphenol hydroxylase-like FAD-dependent oxidoreductase
MTTDATMAREEQQRPAHQQNNSNQTKKRRKCRLDKTASIVILGCGLAGLSAALSLEQAGFSNICILEKDESYEAQKEGYGLTVSYHPKGPLAHLGLLEQAAQQDCPSRSHYVLSPDGSILGYYGNAFCKHRGMGQRGNLRIPRKLLRRILLDKLAHTTIKVHWGHKLVDWTQNENGTFVLCVERPDAATTPQEKGVVEMKADLLVAADGIHSSVVRKIYHGVQPTCYDPETIGLRHMGVRLVLGISDFSHPLLDERGFYTLDGTHRLFTMPYESSRYSSSTEKKNRTMWQLSFQTPDEEYRNSSSLDPHGLQQDVFKRCQSWHDPVLEMIRATPLSTIWGTDLMDRDPNELLQLVQKNHPRLVVLGDALHR